MLKVHKAIKSEEIFQKFSPKRIREEITKGSEWKKHVVACMGEFVGTFLFLWVALAATSFANMPQTSASGNANVTNASNVLYSALAFGFSLTVNAWIFFRVSGGLFNPAITCGLILTGVVPWFRGLLIVITQFLAAIVVSYVVKSMFSSPFNAETLLRPGTTVAQGLFIEALMTFQLLMAIFMLAAEKSKVTFLAPVGIGLAFFVAELVGLYYTGGSLNPARSLGPAVANNNFPSYHWIYYVGPLVGVILASGFYKLLKVLEYNTVLPDQDTDISPEGKAALGVQGNFVGGKGDEEQGGRGRGSGDKKGLGEWGGTESMSKSRGDEAKDERGIDLSPSRLTTRFV